MNEQQIPNEILDITLPTAFSTPKIVKLPEYKNDFINFTCSEVNEVEAFNLQTVQTSYNDEHTKM